MPRGKVAGKKAGKLSKASVATGSKSSKAEKKKKTAPAEGGVKIKRRFRLITKIYPSRS